MTDSADETQMLLDGRTEKARREILGEIFTRHRARLRRMVELRIDSRLRSRIDPSDVIQEAFLEAAERVDVYVANPRMPAFLWIRFITGQKLLTLHRKHLKVKARDARLEVSIDQGVFPAATSDVLAEQLLAQSPSPSEAALLAERIALLDEGLSKMEAIDREILALIHLEQLSNSEAAIVLDVSQAVVRQRHVRAMRRLKDILKELPGGLSDEAS